MTGTHLQELAVSLLLAAALAAGLAVPLPMGQAMAAPSVIADPAPRGACSGRSGAARFVMALPPEGTPGDRMRAGFGPSRAWGLDQNVTLRLGGAVIAVAYPRRSAAPSDRRPLGGAGFYAAAGLTGTETTACLSYRVQFPEGFDFVRGGKLPGLFGGDRPPSGGARPRGDDGFTLRLMWRADGVGELYLYAPNMRGETRKSGMRLGTGAFRFVPGRWARIDLQVTLNRPGASDGTATLWVDGVPRIAVEGIRYRRSDRMAVGGLMFSTFFGGSGARFATPRDQTVLFADLAMFSGKAP
ncbi:MAG TPA: hypothetical protein VLA78_01235 [Paracoccaceae bacterium]|nr:hypothetical protein [Paracoccaceae bacterium]